MKCRDKKACIPQIIGIILSIVFAVLLTINLIFWGIIPLIIIALVGIGIMLAMLAGFIAAKAAKVIYITAVIIGIGLILCGFLCAAVTITLLLLIFSAVIPFIIVVLFYCLMLLLAVACIIYFIYTIKKLCKKRCRSRCDWERCCGC